MSLTKIVATIGPCSNNRETIIALAEAGMNVARLNGSHADLEWHAEAIALLRGTVPENPILLDIPGRKIRTMELARDLGFGAGDRVTFTTDPDPGDAPKAPLNHPGLHEDVREGMTLLADDGSLKFTVLEVRGRDIVCRAECAGALRSRMGINAPSVTFDSGPLTERDREMVDFARAHEVDFVGISFVESAAHVASVRELAGDSWPRVVAKIENQAGLSNIDEIIAVSDAIMIDRGDLSVETNLEGLAIAQKRIINAAKAAGKPVIVATEMLHSMIENPFPTKAEVSDITNAILDGCSAMMLSGETAIGKHPVEAVSVMRRIADASSEHLFPPLPPEKGRDASAIPRAVEESVALICEALPITKIVAVTMSGFAARMLAARQLRPPILAVSNDPKSARSFNLLPGTEGVFLEIPFTRSSTDHLVACLEALWRSGRLSADDLVLVTGVGYPKTGNYMNLIQTHYVGDLCEALGWED